MDNPEYIGCVLYLDEEGFNALFENPNFVSDFDEIVFVILSEDTDFDFVAKREQVLLILIF